ncbi:MAG: hypothetical protein FWG98_06650 [Candidatus Cloacimonetes bacterium]|nr:hypothetical protein [Candidatus Cloacimonadota bacterium]
MTELGPTRKTLGKTCEYCKHSKTIYIGEEGECTQNDEWAYYFLACDAFPETELEKLRLTWEDIEDKIGGKKHKTPRPDLGQVNDWVFELNEELVAEHLECIKETEKKYKVNL